MRSSDLAFLYTLETSELFAGKPCRVSHHAGCGCAPELVRAWRVGGAAERFYADPTSVAARPVAALRRGRIPWSLRTRSGLRSGLLGAAVVLWVVVVAQGWSAIAVVLALVGLLASTTVAQWAAWVVRRRAGATPDSVIEGAELSWAPDLAAAFEAYNVVLDQRVSLLRTGAGREAARVFEFETSAVLFAAARSARHARALAGGAASGGRLHSRQLEAYFDTTVSPPRPRAELLRDDDGTYRDPLLDGVAEHLRRCVASLDELSELIGWYPHSGHVPRGR